MPVPPTLEPPPQPLLLRVLVFAVIVAGIVLLLVAPAAGVVLVMLGLVLAFQVAHGPRVEPPQPRHRPSPRADPRDRARRWSRPGDRHS